MTSKYVGLRRIAEQGTGKEAQVLSTAAKVLPRILPWINRIGRGVSLGARAGMGAVRSTPWKDLARPAGRALWEGSLLAGGVASGVDALREGGHGLKQIAQGDTGEGVKSLGRGGLSALFATMGISPVAKGMKALGRTAQKARGLRSSNPATRNAYEKAVLAGPGLREPGIGARLKDLVHGTSTAQKRPPTTTATLAHNIGVNNAYDPQLGPMLAKMSPTTSRKMISHGEKLDRYSNSAGVLGLLGSLGLSNTLAERDPSQSSDYSSPARYHSPLVDFEDVYNNR